MADDFHDRLDEQLASHGLGDLDRWQPTGLGQAPAELPHMPGCTDPTHRPATSLCTTEPYRLGAIGDPT